MKNFSCLDEGRETPGPHDKELSQLKRQLNDANRRLDAVYRISALAESCDNLSELFGGIHSVISEFFYAKNLLIALYDEGKENVHIPYFQDEKDSQLELPGMVPKDQFISSSLTGYIFRSGRSLLADRARLDRLEKAGAVELRGAQSESWMGLPLGYNGETMGVIVVQSYNTNVLYTEADLELFEYISRQIAATIARKQQHIALVQYRDELEELVDWQVDEITNLSGVMKKQLKQLDHIKDQQQAFQAISQLVQGSECISQVVEHIEETLNKLLHLRSFCLVLNGTNQPPLCFKFNRNPKKQGSVSIHSPCNISLCDYMAQTGESILLNVSDAIPAKLAPYLDNSPDAAWMGAAIVDQGCILGTLLVQANSNKDSFVQDDLAILEFATKQLHNAVFHNPVAAESGKFRGSLEKLAEQKIVELEFTGAKLKKAME